MCCSNTGVTSDSDDHTGHGPKEDTLNRGSHSCAATGSDLDGPSHFPHPGHPWPSRTWQSEVRGRTNRLSPERYSTPPPETAGMTMQPWNPDVIKHRCSLHEGSGRVEDVAQLAQDLVGVFAELRHGSGARLVTVEVDRRGDGAKRFVPVARRHLDEA
jgi:hypothetical protein